VSLASFKKACRRVGIKEWPINKIPMPFPLWDAASEGRTEAVQVLLDEGADIHQKTRREGSSALHAAVQGSHDAIVLLLLEKGARVDLKDKEGRTPLLIAAKKGNSAVILHLLDKGAEVNVTTLDGWTPLHLVIELGHDATVPQLLDKGAGVNVETKEGWTPLFIASKQGHNALVLLLLDKGADINVQTLDLDKALGCVSSGARIQKSWERSSALHAAVKGSHDAVVQQLLGKGPDLNLKDKNGCTPLHLAIDRGQDSVVQQLLEKGAGINLKDKYGYTPLHLAIDRRNGATVQLLVAKGADVNAKPDASRRYAGEPLLSALHAAKDEPDAIFQMLLDKGADVNVRITSGHYTNKYFGYTPLFVVIAEGNDAFVKVLLDNNADVNIVVEWNPNPKFYLERLEYLGGTPLHCAARFGRAAAVQMLLEKKADVNFKARWDADTPLHGAASKGHLDVVQLLLDNGADERAVARSGEYVKNRFHGNHGPWRAQERQGRSGAPQGRDVVFVHSLQRAQERGMTPAELAAYNDESDIADLLDASETRRAERECEAFAMGNDARLGAGSLVLGLDEGVMKMILEEVWFQDQE